MCIRDRLPGVTGDRGLTGDEVLDHREWRYRMGGVDAVCLGSLGADRESLDDVLLIRFRKSTRNHKFYLATPVTRNRKRLQVTYQMQTIVARNLRSIPVLTYSETDVAEFVIDPSASASPAASDLPAVT